MIIRVPGGPSGARVDENASLVDVVPTVLGFTGLKPAKQVQGIDLSGWAMGAPGSKARRPLYSESLWPELYGCCGLYGVIDGNWKYIRAPRPELYDLGQDGNEMTNLVDKRPRIASRLRGQLEQWQKELASAAKPQSDASVSLPQGTLEQLEGLGYTGGGAGPPTSCET